ncbi:uncharacterized protein LOC142939238 [Anarhichas minor]|uniref:uncharacterized protein LOC142939238 n=1 Tax=Anarhichas minor TaxID=65739 RepID=UPI003F73140A
MVSSLLTGLLYHHPEDPISFLQSCLITTRQLGGPEAVTWDTFIHLERQLSASPQNHTHTLINIHNTPNYTINTPQNNTHTLINIHNTPNYTINTPQNNTHTLINILNTPNYTINISYNTINTTNTSNIFYKNITSSTHQVFSITNRTPSGPPETGPEPKLLSPASPAPTVTPLVHTQRKELRDTKTFSTDAPTPGPPPPVRSQLSIDSDSEMTESSGLLQEVSILPPQRPRPLIIFIIGGPGSGKGSQSVRLAHCFSFRVISLDELLRRQLLSHASPSRKWEVISQMMGHGELGPRDETMSELRRQLIGQQEARGFITDGFPQDVHQALSFQEQIGSPDLVILLLCSNETLRCRLQQRGTQLGLLGDNSHALRRRLEIFQRDIVSIC